MALTDIIIIGGGLAGLVNAILLARSGRSVTLFEKKRYPFHRVCGEYVSNEVKPFLIRNDLFPKELDMPSISRFSLSSTNGKMTDIRLNLGGFGISRYALDHFLYLKALESGVEIYQDTAVREVVFEGGLFHVSTGQAGFQGQIVIGAQGKRTRLDADLGRDFLKQKSPYLAVKYHIKTDFAGDTIALHNFEDGYCGISQVEGGAYNLCYLSHRDNLRKAGTIPEMERSILSKNPFLKSIFENSDFLFDQPLVINEVTFEKKSLIENHILMCGDSAGMITPLCGNGMAMAIRGAKILSESIDHHWQRGSFNRMELEKDYEKRWNREFAFRLKAGRTIQQLFGSTTASNVGVALAKIKPIANAIIGLTHGKEF